MKLEDLTKDELIYVIRHNWRHFDEKRIVICALGARQQRLFEMYQVEQRISMDYLREYNNFLKEHDGEQIIDLPMAELEQAQEMLQKQEKHGKKASRYYRESQECYRQASRLMAEER